MTARAADHVHSASDSTVRSIQSLEAARKQVESTHAGLTTAQATTQTAKGKLFLATAQIGAGQGRGYILGNSAMSLEERIKRVRKALLTVADELEDIARLESKLTDQIQEWERVLRS